MDEGVCPFVFLILSFLPITTTLPVLTVLSPGQLSSITLFLLQHCFYFFTIPLLAVCWVMAVVISVFCSGIVACYRLLVCSAQPFQTDCFVKHSSCSLCFFTISSQWLLHSILLFSIPLLAVHWVVAVVFNSSCLAKVFFLLDLPYILGYGKNLGCSTAI